jgi:Fe-S-cluster containining protein
LRRVWNDNPDSSVVTWLRRRENFAASPCIFLKYIRDPDGTPHRICSIHDGRPLSCREYYFSHCKRRGTGELAALLAEGFEKLRDGEITEEMVDAQLRRFAGQEMAGATIGEHFEYSFWAEMKCAVNLEQANIEGSKSYDMADYQDPIDEKLNRVISSKYLRYEESYGLEPHDEQLMPYSAGLSFAASPERQRIMKLVDTPPSLGLFSLRNFPYYMGVRTLMPGVRHAAVFPTIPARAGNDLLKTIPRLRLFANHPDAGVREIELREIYAAILKAVNHLIRFSSHIVALEPILELEPPGTLERRLLSRLAGFANGLNPYLAGNPYLQPVIEHLAEISIARLEEELEGRFDLFDCCGSLQTLQRLKPTLTAKLRQRLAVVQKTAYTKLRRNGLRRALNFANPIAARRLAGRSLGSSAALQDWSEWYGQILAVRYAGLAGYSQFNLKAYYRQAVDELGQIAVKRAYAVNLLEAAKYIAFSMTGFNDLAVQGLPYRASADRLATYAIDLFTRMEGPGEGFDEESIAEFLTAIYKGLGLSYSHDRNPGLMVQRLLASQLADGSWQTNPLPHEIGGTQGEFLERRYRITCACALALMPLRNDLLNPENAALGLL